MNIRFFALMVTFLPVTSLPAQLTLPPAAPPYFRVRYEPSSQPGELAFGVSYTVWIPAGVKTLRGVIVHQHGCGEGACRGGETAAFDLHWQALARKHGCALIGPSYEQPEKAACSLWCDPRNGSGKKFLQALRDLAERSGHSELATAPWALWGHSGGANWAGTMLVLHPQRIAAVWLRSGSPRLVSLTGQAAPPEIPAAAYAVPVMCNLGIKERDDRFAGLWKSTLAFFEEFRGQGALIGVAVDPNSSHDCGHSRYLAIPWLDACLTARLPGRPGAALKPMPTNRAWLAPLFGDKADPAKRFAGDAKTAVWLPDRLIAKAWAEYSKDGNVSDLSRPPAPTQVRASPTGELTWEAEADLESGLAGFIITRDGVNLARVPAQPGGTIGRPLFQKMSYHDTPVNPLPQMRFTDETARPGAKHRYRICAVNSAGLESKPSSAAVAP
jgi:pimeloyl-ACP methyl ester carboxylesterase